MIGDGRLTVVAGSGAGICEGDVCVIPSASSGSMATLADIPFATTDGRTATLADYAGRVVLVVNVASKCGLTPQYEGLQRLYTEQRERGLVVLGFPANDFMGQEPGTDAEIAEFCSTNYSVTFPIMAKVSVVGEDRHPLYAELARQAPTAAGKAEFRDQLRKNGIVPTEDPDVLWNFEKFLIARDGTVVGRFASSTTAQDSGLLAVIDDVLVSVDRLE